MSDTERMPLVYVAGPYRAAGEYEVRENVRRAEALALVLWKAGVAVICPHKNTERLGGACPDEVWLKGDLEMVRRCDGMAMVVGWRKSAGATGERELADSLGIPVIECTAPPAKVAEWARSLKLRCA